MIGLGAMGLGVALAGAGLGFSLAASSVQSDLPASPSQADVAAANQRIESRDTMAAVGYVSGGALVAAGAVLFFWPAAKNVRVTARPGGGVVGWGASF